MSAHEARERLEDEITWLAAHIAAATCDLLLIGRYDQQNGGVQHGLASCAHWLQWRCGTNPGAAREKVRVARVLPNLPQISAAFREGSLSYSKVRAISRIAKPENEPRLLNMALHVLSLSDAKGLEITARSLWTEWTGEPIDCNYAQGVLAQHDPDGR